MTQTRSSQPVVPPPRSPAAAGPVGARAVVDRLRALAGRGPATDGVAVFLGAYLPVVAEAARPPGAGERPERRLAATLTLRCAERALTALETAAADGRGSACWRPLLDARHHPGVRPVQFALAGVNAQLGCDLPLALVDVCRTLRRTPTELADAFERVADRLVLLEERVREELTPGQELLRLADPLVHLLGCRSAERARDGAWLAARALWQLRQAAGGGAAGLDAEYAAQLDRSVGLAGRILLTPLPVARRR
ncbi:DUF5995 family protein [Streptomyces lichenis]|uniref:DUF5995 family protein n=1 Tax=Streptomyces lichenis TaxID=2306967 RepID=A0ABT0IJK9_9ACTN|nr:DUF5995 family protein [Streptomyces lichenis]MCK8681452.1 DUF5995 family protein [Streptomyces lichenis]